MEVRKSKLKLVLGAGCALAVLASAAAASAEERTFNVASARAADTIPEFARQAGIQIVAPADHLQGVKTPAIEGSYDTRQALAMLIAGTGLHIASDDGRTVMLASDPQSGSAAGDGADGTVAALIVTAQKREEAIQDVPIAISAFTEKTLEEQKIEGGFDLLKAIPNVTFSKNNFTSYNFSIRGIGTKAVSATTDPGVAVSFNNIALLQNRLFEQEYFDVERVEVLRGPQGTLYGRNATAGVVNVISAKPNLQEFSGWLKGEVGNYHSKRASAMVNVPLIEGKLGIRFAGALTDRQGYDYNSGTKHAVNGRDLWSARLTIGLNPTDAIRTNLVWERFTEDDNRSRTGKQLCYRDEGLGKVGDAVVGLPDIDPGFNAVRRSLFSQGCKPGSLYDAAAFGTPNGLALPFVSGLIFFANNGQWPLSNGEPHTIIGFKDPYGGMMQTRDLRVIDSFRDPVYRAKADVVELNADWDVSDALKWSVQAAYNKDRTYSFQDYNRFNTVPIFADSSQFWSNYGENPYRNLTPGGVLCDPQLGCSRSIAGFDIAQANGEQITFETRLQSDFDGPLNFSIGANYTRFKTTVDYYVFYNLITAYAMIPPFDFPEFYSGGMTSIDICYFTKTLTPAPRGDPGTYCPYIDPNPIESINGEGHNYFRSKNPYKLKSAAAFAEGYWNIKPDLKLTAGLRFTDDRKTFIPVPSQVLTAVGIFAGGAINRGYPEQEPIEQHWGEWTGRLGLDWKPKLSWTDQTLVYGFFSRGYKAGGANPPSPQFGTMGLNQAFSELYQFPVNLGPEYDKPILELTGVDYGPTFDPEFVNAFELGTKNTLLGGAATLNATAFFYDYKDYQVSQIKNRTAVNENFDARAWGLEFETIVSPSRHLQIVGNLGYLDTEIADGESSIDIMNRTQGNPNLVLARPWVQIPSNCVVPVIVAESYLNTPGGGGFNTYQQLCGGTHNILDLGAQQNGTEVIDPLTGVRYDPRTWNGQNGTININGGAGIRAQLGGKELPNAPHWTANMGAQYGWDLSSDWRVTVRGDAYWQSQSWARVYNAVNDKLHGWYNANLSVWFERPEDDLKIELYAKNILDETPITDAFINSDDTALTTNVFVLDPRLIGLSIKKGF